MRLCPGMSRGPAWEPLLSSIPLNSSSGGFGKRNVEPADRWWLGPDKLPVCVVS